MAIDNDHDIDQENGFWEMIRNLVTTGDSNANRSRSRWQAGYDLTTEIMRTACSKADFNYENWKNHAYDRVLFDALPMQSLGECAGDPLVQAIKRKTFLSSECRLIVFKMFEHLSDTFYIEFKGLVNENNDDLHEVVGGGESETQTKDLPDVSSKESHQPLRNKAALVLETGRDDGITQECCLKLAHLGAKVALAFDPADNGFEAASRVVQNVQSKGGTIVSVEGIPYRHAIYSDGADAHAGFVGHLVKRALAMLQVDAFHVIGMYAALKA